GRRNGRDQLCQQFVLGNARIGRRCNIGLALPRIVRIELLRSGIGNRRPLAAGLLVPDPIAAKHTLFFKGGPAENDPDCRSLVGILADPFLAARMIEPSRKRLIADPVEILLDRLDFRPVWIGRLDWRRIVGNDLAITQKDGFLTLVGNFLVEILLWT